MKHRRDLHRIRPQYFTNPKPVLQLRNLLLVSFLREETVIVLERLQDEYGEVVFISGVFKVLCGLEKIIGEGAAGGGSCVSCRELEVLVEDFDAFEAGGGSGGEFRFEGVVGCVAEVHGCYAEGRGVGEGAAGGGGGHGEGDWVGGDEMHNR